MKLSEVKVEMKQVDSKEEMKLKWNVVKLKKRWTKNEANRKEVSMNKDEESCVKVK